MVEPGPREAEWLLLAATGLDAAQLAMVDSVDAAAEARVLELAGRRAAGEPLQYVTGVAGFRRLELSVGPGVLVPRPETEVVAERAMARLPEKGILVDIGTGSGALALAVADERPDARVFATESSPSALEWARHNRDALGLDVELIECDLLSGLPSELRGAVDVVVSNPPYVATHERDVLPPDVVDHEPEEALFAGPEGTRVMERVATQGLEWLRAGGWLVLEIGHDQALRVAELLAGRGYEAVNVHPDHAGKQRIAEGRVAS